MSFIRYKIINGNKYAYEVTSYWDSNAQTSRHKSKYLGMVNNNKIIENDLAKQKEQLILDFGDGYLLHEYMKQSVLYNIFIELFVNKEIIPLIFYKVVMQSAMYNCNNWLNGNIIMKLYPEVDLSSQNISRILAILGDERLQRQFFNKHIETIGGAKKTVIIDATSLPNQINSPFNAWGHADNSIEKQFRFLCALEQKTKIPIFYRYLPGNIADVSTLKQTILELSKLGIKNSFILMDAGYCSEKNIHDLYLQNIKFLTRLPASRKHYKELIKNQISDIENIKYAVKIGARAVFVKDRKIELYGHTAYAYIVLDPNRKGKELNKFLLEYFDEKEEDDEYKFNKIKFNNCGIMILIASHKIIKEEVLSCYYMRQSIEQIFGYFKDDLSVLPIRTHNEKTIRGYLFLQFLTLIFFIQLHEKLKDYYTVEQAMLILRNLKCKVFDKEVIISELSKQQKNIFKKFNILVPNSLGI